MKLFKTLLTLIVLGTLISGCGAEPVPTMSAADVQSTAVAAASTMVAQTQAAVPTATPLPPTDTPTATLAATDTPPPSPTLQFTLTAVPPTKNPNADPCDTRVLSSPKGKPTTIRIVNTTKYAVTVSMYLNETDSHGECGYRSYNLSKNNDVVISDLVQGCYNFWAWSTDPKKSFNVASGTSCVNNPDKWTFEISTSSIQNTGP